MFYGGSVVFRSPPGLAMAHIRAGRECSSSHLFVLDETARTYGRGIEVLVAAGYGSAT